MPGAALKSRYFCVHLDMEKDLPKKIPYQSAVRFKDIYMFDNGLKHIMLHRGMWSLKKKISQTPIRVTGCVEKLPVAFYE